MKQNLLTNTIFFLAIFSVMIFAQQNPFPYCNLVLEDAGFKSYVGFSDAQLKQLQTGPPAPYMNCVKKQTKIQLNIFNQQRLSADVPKAFGIIPNLQQALLVSSTAALS